MIHERIGAIAYARLGSSELDGEKLTYLDFISLSLLYPSHHLIWERWIKKYVYETVASKFFWVTLTKHVCQLPGQLDECLPSPNCKEDERIWPLAHKSYNLTSKLRPYATCTSRSTLISDTYQMLNHLPFLLGNYNMFIERSYIRYKAAGREKWVVHFLEKRKGGLASASPHALGSVDNVGFLAYPAFWLSSPLPSEKLLELAFIIHPRPPNNNVFH